MAQNKLMTPVANRIPRRHKEQETDNYVDAIINRLNEIRTANDPKTLRNVLLYKPESKAGSHIDDHLPKTNTAISANEALAQSLDILYDKADAIDREQKKAHSKFIDPDTARKAIISGIINNFKYESYLPGHNDDSILKWLQGSYAGNLAIVIDTADISNVLSSKTQPIGYGFRRDDGNNLIPFETNTITVVLKKNDPLPGNLLGFNGMGFHILTAYPGEKEPEKIKTPSAQKDIDVLKRDDIKLGKVIKNSENFQQGTTLQKTFMRLQLSPACKLSFDCTMRYDRRNDTIIIDDPKDEIGGNIRTIIKSNGDTLESSSHYRTNGGQKIENEHLVFKFSKKHDNYMGFINKTFENVVSKQKSEQNNIFRRNTALKQKPRELPYAGSEQEIETVSLIAVPS